jgi:hypothetical protein
VRRRIAIEHKVEQEVERLVERHLERHAKTDGDNQISNIEMIADRGYSHISPNKKQRRMAQHTISDYI